MSSVNQTNDWIDGSLYPDKPVPQALPSLPDKVDFLVRVCAAWDFGMPPKAEVLNEILQDRWKPVVEEAYYLTSCAYHLVRQHHQLEEVPYLGPQFPEILNDPCLQLM